MKVYGGKVSFLLNYIKHVRDVVVAGLCYLLFIKFIQNYVYVLSFMNKYNVVSFMNKYNVVNELSCLCVL